jgi:hypothetical protein
VGSPSRASTSTTRGATGISRADIDGTHIKANFVRLAVNSNGITDIAINGGYIYWANSTTGAVGSVGRARLDGTDALTIVPSALDLFGVAADSLGPKPLAPMLAKTLVGSLVSGQVEIETPGSTTFAPLTGTEQIPVGSIVNATSGRVELTAAAKRKGTNAGEFYAGEFKLTQSRGGLTRLALTGGKPCVGAAKVVGHRKPREQRSLWGHARGRFETSGQGAAAIVIDPRWLTEDTCSGTTIRVTQGRVRVIDFATHRRVVVRAGHSYHAR